MNIEIKKSTKPVKYKEAIAELEARLKLVSENNGKELVWILEHEPVFTAGTSYSKDEILDKSINVHKTNRGGKITYHGPGQLVFYFVIDLRNKKKDLRKFISIIEDTIIETLKQFKIKSHADRKNIGIWFDNKGKLEKVAAQNILWASMAKETAHQIATPLSALMGWNSLLNERGVSPEITLEINKDLERLSTISNRFSSIGLETGLDKVALIQSTQEGIQYLSDRFPKSVDIQFQSKLEPHIIPLNKPLYFWCLENLIKNSIDAMKGHGIIIVEIAKNKKYIVVSVQDHGPGIEKKYLKKVTNPGFSTKKSGWGLGLSLTKRIVTQFHKGVLKIHSETNKGTRIEMHFPMA